MILSHFISMDRKFEVIFLEEAFEFFEGLKEKEREKKLRA